MKRLAFIIMWFLYSFIFKIYAQELPPIRNFIPNEYGGGTQNWAISQDANSNIYVANNKGLLKFNGAQWELFPSPNNSIMRSVLATHDKIYTGCHMEFGFWQQDEFGILNYTSLSNTVKDLIEDEEFWNILSIDNWVLFQSLNRIYIYSTIDQSFNIINSDTKINKIYRVEDDVYFQRINVGIFKIENGKETIFIDHPIVETEVVINMFYNQNGLVIQTQENGLYIYTDNVLKPWGNSINNTIKNYSVYNSIKLNEGIALGTISNGVVLLSEDNQVDYVINKANGLNNNTILGLFQDKQQNLWLGLDNGIVCLNLNSPFRVYYDENGGLGSVYTAAIYDDNLYLGTNQGLFSKPIDKKEEFKFIEGTHGQVWSLKLINGTLFCGHNSGTFIVDDNAVTKVSSIQGCWDIKPVLKTTNLLLQGDYDGLTVLEKNGNLWTVRNKIEGFKNSSKSFEFFDAYTVYVNHEYKGIYKVKLDANYEKALHVSVDTINKGLNSHLLKYNDNILYAYQNGIFKLNEQDNNFVKDSVLNNLYNNTNYLSGKLINDEDHERLWSFNNTSITYLEPSSFSKKLSQETIYLGNNTRNSVIGYESLLYLDKDKYLHGTSNGYITFDLNKIKDSDYQIGLDIIKNSQSKGGEMTSVVKKEIEGDFASEVNNFEFSFSIPNYQKFALVEYQYKLEGLYDSWSDWSQNSTESFQNLPFGDYVFKARGRVNNKITSNEVSYVFSIDRPWLLSNTMIGFYALALLLFSLMMHNIYKRYYAKQRQKLVERNKKELALKELESRQEIMRLNNERLKSDIASKNRELATSTMSLIKKNEFLSKIKEELGREKDENLKGVIRLIDKNINSTDDWKLFEEAFNNADKDFLKKVKTMHSGLTPNDLRLCAYLRLNLSSKEIAPLLNISPRSVEVKRYRLRKKMNLSHEKSLTNYILEI